MVTDDRGSGTVLTAALLVVVAGLASVVTTLGSAVLARHRAEAAADLAALAGATALVDPLAAAPGAGAPCRRADAVAADNGASLLLCRATGDGSLSVTVAVAVSGVLTRWSPVTASARAGPAPN